MNMLIPDIPRHQHRERGTFLNAGSSARKRPLIIGTKTMTYFWKTTNKR